MVRYYVRPQTPVTANGAAKSTSPPPIPSLPYHSFVLIVACFLTSSLSRLSLDDGRANREPGAVQRPLLYFSGPRCIACLSKQACNGTSPLPPSLCKTAHVLHMCLGALYMTGRLMCYSASRYCTHITRPPGAASMRLVHRHKRLQMKLGLWNLWWPIC